MTVPQIRVGIAVVLYNAYQCGTTSRLLHEQARRLQRNELARLYTYCMSGCNVFGGKQLRVY